MRGDALMMLHLHFKLIAQEMFLYQELSLGVTVAMLLQRQYTHGDSSIYSYDASKDGSTGKE